MGGSRLAVALVPGLPHRDQGQSAPAGLEKQHPATKSARPSASEPKDAHLPRSGGTKSARASKKRGPRMVSRRP
eukprot:14756-Chlamydomonas_euryale.AAC.1